MKKISKIFAIVAMLLVIVLPLSAGGSKESATTEDGRPIITMWAPLNPNIAQVAQSFGDTV